ncbi:MAG: hypothetical protein ACRDPC_18120 [Solirubrobacteraceae bacterium]
MRSPIVTTISVTEAPLQLEPVEPDPFINGLIRPTSSPGTRRTAGRRG